MSELDYGFRPHNNAARPQEELENNGFLPNLSIAELSLIYGVPKSFNDDQLTHVLLIAADRINSSAALQEWQAKQQAKGFTKLEETARSFGTKNAAVEQYKRAVYASAKADLIRDHIAIDRKPDATAQAQDGEEQVNFYERQSTRALAELVEEKSIGVYLL